MEPRHIRKIPSTSQLVDGCPALESSCLLDYAEREEAAKELFM